ncbi:MAG: PHD and RING finger domain-containing protein 1 [Heterodermia speciosa]|uniref:PHD and RING finger domain-containing protein 1 n=1 Tax=Heterodermia speciosa TaxID=116794 RepID=A0A8H3IHN9_9LECA|nr:MAG: PHD and RING finger domain-containing protein 1 [Heterodermia speciosa]
MSETCIVCLGDLGENANDPPRSDAAHIKSEAADHGARPVTLKSPLQRNNTDTEMIAHLLPCGHDLHNDCLKPWVERANSCPICRQAFNQVDLSAQIGGKPLRSHLSEQEANGIIGPVMSSYPVADRTQVEEIDPSMFTDDVEDDFELQPCPLCGEDDNEDHLLACDGCGVDYHTYCVDLDEVPRGHWFCETCDTQRAIDSVAHPIPRAQPQHNRSDRRTRGQRRRARGSNPAASHGSSGWARVWQSVWDRLNLDLDFPFDEGSTASRANRSQLALAQEHEWRRRLRVAERHGGPNRFRDTASTLLENHNARDDSHRVQPQSQAESADEIRAWNTFERAKKEEARSLPSNRRKRKSTTTSPSDAEPVHQPEQPHRQLKRPRTRRNLDHLEPQSDTTDGIANSRRSSVVAPSASRPSNTSDLALRGQGQGQGPSFLRSLLKEVESSAVSDETQRQNRPTLSTLTGRSSPQLSSPGGSPTTSNHATPRALSATPPPPSIFRPGSPLSFTSKVEPLYPPSDFSPSSPEVQQRSMNHKHVGEGPRQPRPRHQSPQASSPPPSKNTSPSRLTMSASAKSDLSSMVAAALKPYYKSNAVNKDQYTHINRDVSHMLYDTVGDQERINDDNREKWEKVAVDEVAKAVKVLQPQT